MRSPKNKVLILGSVSLILLIVDQWSKYVIRTTPELQNVSLIDGWLAFNFTKNPGMALGITWADTYIISLIAIVATIGIIYYIVRTLKYANTAYLICMGLIIGGALGNITDRIFIAKIMGYGSWLDGHVVDFIHFNLEIGEYRVFPYIFNVADMGISIAIITLLIFGKWILPPGDPEKIKGDGEGEDSAGTELDAGEKRIDPGATNLHSDKHSDPVAPESIQNPRSAGKSSATASPGTSVGLERPASADESETPIDPEAPVGPETPLASDTPLVSDSSRSPELPHSPELPRNPGSPDEPPAPRSPVQPGSPLSPPDAEEPKTPPHPEKKDKKTD